jgi:hypothetical protein
MEKEVPKNHVPAKHGSNQGQRFFGHKSRADEWNLGEIIYSV